MREGSLLCPESAGGVHAWDYDAEADEHVCALCGMRSEVAHYLVTGSIAVDVADLEQEDRDDGQGKARADEETA